MLKSDFLKHLYYNTFMDEKNKNNPLHGKTLKIILDDLVNEYGYKKLYQTLKFQCFYKDPSINSSLKFIRKNEWAREKIDTLYIQMLNKKGKRQVAIEMVLDTRLELGTSSIS